MPSFLDSVQYERGGESKSHVELGAEDSFGRKVSSLRYRVRESVVVGRQENCVDVKMQIKITIIKLCLRTK